MPKFIGEKTRNTCKSPPKEDKLALKKIVEPFLNWYSSQFNECAKNIDKYPDLKKIFEEELGNEGGFRVDEQTLYNMLSSELQGSSKVHSSRNYQIMPTLPPNLAEKANLPRETYLHKVETIINEQKKFTRGTHDIGIVKDKTNSRTNKVTVGKEKEIRFSNNFVDTEELCKNLQHLRIVQEFMKHVQR